MNELHMLASTSFRITESPGIRTTALWLITAVAVFLVIDGLATRPHAVHMEQFREEGMSDEHLLSIALQEARASETNAWWINDRTSYIVFDGNRTYDISDDTFRAFGLRKVDDAAQDPIARVERASEITKAGIGSTGRVQTEGAGR
ncbi:MAG: hypothetical protein HKN17_01955 [Rhodothermales bacterium]|nr:hypothetical protein [Rhodothermales bacterium]